MQIVSAVIKLASELKNEKVTLVDYLNGIYDEFGHQIEKMFSHKLYGAKVKNKITEIMTRFKTSTPEEIEGRKIECVEDFLKSECHLVSSEVETIDLPKADVIKLHFKDGWIELRPSGTEMKNKLYVSLETDDIDEETGRINDMVFGEA